MKLLIAILIVTATHAQAGFWRSVPVYAKFWRMVLCELVTEKLVTEKPQRHPYDGLPNKLLVDLYLRRGAKASWANETSRELQVMGDQLRWNHEVGQAPLNDDQLAILDRYKHFEAEYDGLRPWRSRVVGEQ